MKQAKWKGSEAVLPNIGIARPNEVISGDDTIIDSYVEQGLAEPVKPGHVVERKLKDGVSTKDGGKSS